jgi:hypothetical protein
VQPPTHALADYFCDHCEDVRQERDILMEDGPYAGWIIPAQLSNDGISYVYLDGDHGPATYVNSLWTRYGDDPLPASWDRPDHAVPRYVAF